MGNGLIIPPPISQANVSVNDSSGEIGAPLGFPPALYSPFFWPFLLPAATFTDLMTHCHVQNGKFVWLAVKIFILVMSLPANAGLLWMLLNKKRAMTPSEVLGVNVSIVGILYCLCLPLDIYSSLRDISETSHSVREALFTLNIFGCPLLLTFMCLERCLAAVLPVAYIRLGRWEYRAVLCGCAWILTLAVGLLVYFLGFVTMTLPLSATISLLFLVMLLCLLGIVWVLVQNGPGESSGASVPLKRRALKNVLAVMVPSTVAYSPLVAVVPYMSVIKLTMSGTLNSDQCEVLQFLFVFPNFGLFIGPMFYFSRIRQVICRGRKSGTQTQ